MSVEDEIAAYRQARLKKDWPEADRIRSSLAQKGLSVRVQKDGTVHVARPSEPQFSDEKVLMLARDWFDWSRARRWYVPVYAGPQWAHDEPQLSDDPEERAAQIRYQRHAIRMRSQWERNARHEGRPQG